MSLLNSVGYVGSVSVVELWVAWVKQKWRGSKFWCG